MEVYWAIQNLNNYNSQIPNTQFIRPATELPPLERAQVQNSLPPGHILLGAVQPHQHQIRPPTTLTTSTPSRPRQGTKKRKYKGRKYGRVRDIEPDIEKFNSMKIPADGSTSKMEPKVFQIADENHGSVVQTMFQNFREVSTLFTFVVHSCCGKTRNSF